MFFSLVIYLLFKSLLPILFHLFSKKNVAIVQLLLCHKARKGCFKGKVIYDIHTAVAGTCVYGMFALVHLRNTYCIYGDGDVSALDFILCCCICMHIVITGMAL